MDGWDDDAEPLRRGRLGQPLGVWWLGVIGLGVALLLLIAENLQAYGVALGGTLGLLALLRAVLPTRRVGGLSVRSRWVDVTTLLLLGAAVALLATNLRQI